MPLQVQWQGEEWGKNFIFSGRNPLVLCVSVVPRWFSWVCTYGSTHCTEHNGDVPVTVVPLLAEVKVSAVETVMQYRISGC